MLKKKNQLFRIIAALQPTEKAYFKKFGYKQDKKDSVLVALFDLADSLMQREGDNFEEGMLVEAFEGRFPTQKYVKVKSRLLDLLLDALREYDKKSQEVEKVYDLLAYAVSLKKRNLFFDAWQVLRKAESLAEELEMLELLIIIRTRLYYYEIYSQKFTGTTPENEKLERLLEDVEDLRKRVLADWGAFRVLHFQKTIGAPRKKADLELLQEIMQEPAFQDEFSLDLAGVKLNTAVAKNGLFFSTGALPAVLENSKSLIDAYQPGKKLQKLNSAKYLSLFDSFLQAAQLAGDIALFEEYFPKFREAPTFGRDDENLKLGIEIFNESMYVVKTGQFDRLEKLRDAFQSIENSAYIPAYRKISIGYYLVLGHFLVEDWDKAFRLCQWMMNARELGMRYDIEVGIRTMECLILLETQDLDLLEYRLRALNDWLKTVDRKMEMEHAVLALLRKCLAHPGLEDAVEVWQSAKTEMESVLVADPSARTFLVSFEILKWLDAKLEGKGFAEVYYG